jgi:DNA-binding IclR family transcriptional regulator
MGQTASIDTVEPEEPAKASGSQTLLRGLDVIDALIDGPLSLADLSETLELTRSTTHRLAAALVDRRMLSFRPREGYTLGPKLAGTRARGQPADASAAHRPAVAGTAVRATEDTVHLGVLDGYHALYLDKVSGRRRINIGSRLGERHPIASTGLGKALILDKTEPEWTDFYAPRRARDSTARAVWLERMRGYAAKGYAFDLEENEDQIRCVAAPVRGVDGQVVAAISVSSAAQYMSDARMAELTEDRHRRANAISRDLGWSPKP